MGKRLTDDEIKARADAKIAERHAAAERREKLALCADELRVVAKKLRALDAEDIDRELNRVAAKIADIKRAE
jgi:hypothetical protein